MYSVCRDNPVSQESLLDALGQIPDPLLDRSYPSLGAVEALTFDAGCARLTIRLGMRPAPQHQRWQSLLKHALEQAGAPRAEVNIGGDVMACPERNRTGHLKGVKNVLMVASGKGGVGKSTSAVNLALALAGDGASVGLLDADIYGPSQRTMLGVADGTRPKLVDGNCIEPVAALGLKTMSIAYMSAARTPVIWRGSMAVRALTQLLEQTLWGELDYLVIDMPPGTGDIQISLAQQLKVAGAVVVTTPQEIALIDARKGVEMFNKTGIPVLGIVENMAAHLCSNCGHADSIFGAHGADRLAADYGVRVLGSLPLDSRICADVDAGLPSVVRDPNGAVADAYFALAQRVAAELWRANLERADVEGAEVSPILVLEA